MPAPVELANSWSSAEVMMEKGDHSSALDELRTSWDLCENDTQRAKTLKMAGDAGTALGVEDPDMQRVHWRKALKSYRNSMKMDPKNKETRKAMNNLSSMMDANAISRGVGFQLMDEGNPTPFGLFAIVAVIMMSLVAVKVISDMLTEEEGNPVVSMEVSYVDSETGQRTLGTIDIELFQDDAPVHVENMVLHASQGNYDNTIFHRIIEDFMNQGGDIDNQNGAGGYVAKWFGYCDGESRSSLLSLRAGPVDNTRRGKQRPQAWPWKTSHGQDTAPRIREVASSTSCQREVRPAISMASTLCLER